MEEGVLFCFLMDCHSYLVTVVVTLQMSLLILRGIDRDQSLLEVLLPALASPWVQGLTVVQAASRQAGLGEPGRLQLGVSVGSKRLV